MPAARDGAGNPIDVVGAWSDVTARKQLAEALAAAQERLVHLFRYSAQPKSRTATAPNALQNGTSLLGRPPEMPLTSGGARAGFQRGYTLRQRFFDLIHRAG